MIGSVYQNSAENTRAMMRNGAGKALLTQKQSRPAHTGRLCLLRNHAFFTAGAPLQQPHGQLLADGIAEGRLRLPGRLIGRRLFDCRLSGAGFFRCRLLRCRFSGSGLLRRRFPGSRLSACRFGSTGFLRCSRFRCRGSLNLGRLRRCGSRLGCSFQTVLTYWHVHPPPLPTQHTPERCGWRACTLLPAGCCPAPIPPSYPPG